MSGTRLFQQAGSPLIQGRSKLERSFASDWLRAWGAVVLTAAVAMSAWGVFSGNLLHGGWIDALFEIVHMSVVLFAPGALIGGAIGVWIGRRYGSTYPWRPGWVLGAVLGAIGVWVEIIAFAELFGVAT